MWPEYRTLQSRRLRIWFEGSVRAQSGGNSANQKCVMGRCWRERSICWNEGAPQFWRPPAASCCISVWRGKKTFCSVMSKLSCCSLFSASVENVFLSKRKKICGGKKCFPWDWKKKSVPTFNAMFPALYVHCVNNTVKPLVLHRWCKAMQVGFFYG